MSIVLNLVLLYIAYFIVLIAHEIGHMPKKIKLSFKYGVFPSAYAYQGLSRYGGLAVNVLLFFAVYHFAPENQLFLYVGLLAWMHFILYAVFGGFLPEKKESQVNVKTHVFDDVPNEYRHVFVALAAIAFLLFYEFYIPILTGVFA